MTRLIINAPMTCQQVADQLGISSSNVSLIEKRALKKCRAILEHHGLAQAQLTVVFRGDSDVMPNHARYWSALAGD